MELPYPTLNLVLYPDSKTILIWGGSSSVGGTAIQLATASGLIVLTTASKSNLGYVKSLGARYAFDYRSGSVVDAIEAVLKGHGSRLFVGAYDAI